MARPASGVDIASVCLGPAGRWSEVCSWSRDGRAGKQRVREREGEREREKVGGGGGGGGRKVRLSVDSEEIIDHCGRLMFVPSFSFQCLHHIIHLCFIRFPHALSFLSCFSFSLLFFFFLIKDNPKCPAGEAFSWSRYLRVQWRTQTFR